MPKTLEYDSLDYLDVNNFIDVWKRKIKNIFYLITDKQYIGGDRKINKEVR